MSHAEQLRAIIARLEGALDSEEVDEFAIVIDELNQMLSEMDAADELLA